MIEEFTKIGDVLPKMLKQTGFKNLHVVREKPENRFCQYCKSKMKAVEKKPYLGISTQKQWVMKINFDYICPNNCEAKMRHREEHKKRYRAAKTVWENTGFSRECVGWTLQKMTCENIHFLRQYAAEFNRFSKALVLLGNKGTGKTLSSECIAKILVKRGLKVRITNMTEINIEMNSALFKNNFKEFIDELLRYDLLIIDDFGREQYTTEKSLENVFYLFNTLTKNHKPFIVSVNPEMLALISHKPQLDACLDRFRKSSRVKTLKFEKDSFRK